MPRVSIGLPVRNGENYLEEALESICYQTFRDFDVLISDNASDDRTEEIARRYVALDSRIRYHRHPVNIGASKNYNYVFHHTQGAFFHWAAHDDVLRPSFLEECVAAFDREPGDTVLVYAQTLLIDAAGRPLRSYRKVSRKGGRQASERLNEMIGPGDHSASLLHMCFPIFGLIRRSALERTSLIANMPRSDDLLLVQLALLGPFVEIDDEVFLRREHEGGSVIAAERVARGPELERLLAAWFDPNRKAVFPATFTKLGFGYLKAVMWTPMVFRERLACLKYVLGWIFRHKKLIVREILLVATDIASSFWRPARGSDRSVSSTR
jgi:glycosyltransferase involved in cell wall biosynthesis